MEIRKPATALSYMRPLRRPERSPETLRSLTVNALFIAPERMFQPVLPESDLDVVQIGNSEPGVSKNV